jgi:quinoprotein glucose dehydrogenase
MNRRKARRRSTLALAVLLACTCFSAGGMSTHSAAHEWPSYGNDAGGSRYSPLDQINRSNVGRLQRVWTYHTGEKMTGRLVAFEATPIMVGGVLYFSTPGGQVIALDAETGRRIWGHEMRAGARRFYQHRGVSYWTNGIDRRILFGTPDGRLVSLNAVDGTPDPRFGARGSVDLRVGVADRWPESEYAVTSPPAIYRDLVITGALVPEGPAHGPSGTVRAFNILTGRLAWEFRTIPGPHEPGGDTWEGDSAKDRTGVNVWSVMSVDRERGLLFLPLGSPAYDFYGGDRKGQNLYANCLVALDAATGKVRWYYQMVHHDVWDYDLPAQPNLIEIRRDGKAIAAVAQVTKMGFVFVLDRLTGKPLFPVEERPVPRSPVEGEASWPTQPFPVKPPPLARISVTRDALNNVSSELNRQCVQMFDQLKGGSIFTPFGNELTLVMPGTLGGATWSGACFDPVSGYFFVNVNETGAIGAVKPQPPGSPVGFRRASPWGEYARFWDEKTRTPCVKPPWGTLSAIDMNTGEIAWRVPLGIVDDLVARGIPPTGTPNLGGAVATAGGLVFIGGSNDARFRAFDSRSGKELWSGRLEASGHATPMTYMGSRTGKQFVVIAAGGGGYFSSTASDTLAAYSLP